MSYIECELNIFNERQAEFKFNGRLFADAVTLDQACLQRLQATMDPVRYGLELFQAVFRGKIALGYRQASGAADADNGFLRVGLRVSPTAPKELHELEWELLQDPDKSLTFAHSGNIAFSRKPNFEKHVTSNEKPKILVVVSCPSDQRECGLDEFDRAGSIRFLKKTLDEADLPLEYKILEVPATPANIRDELLKGRFQALHIHAHGVMGDKSASIILEKPNLEADYVDEKTFFEIFEGYHDLRLVTLVACYGGASPDSDPHGGLAGRLLETEVPAVVVMRKSVPMDAAARFTGCFYKYLGMYGFVDAAMNEARKQLFLASPSQSRVWSVPTLHMGLRDGKIWSDTQELQPVGLFLQQAKILLADAHMTPDDAEKLYLLSVPDQSVVRRLRSINEILDDLWDRQPREEEAVLPLLEFVFRVGKLLNRNDLVGWVFGKVAPEEFQGLWERLKLETEGYDHLLIEIPSATASALNYWRVSDDEWSSPGKWPCPPTLDGIRNSVWDLIEETNRLSSRELMIEFFVSLELLAERVDFLERDLGGFSAKLPERHRVHVRWRERAQNGLDTDAPLWKRVATRIRDGSIAAIRPYWVSSDKKPNLVLSRVGQPGNGSCVGFEFVPVRSGNPRPNPLLIAALRGGAPFLFWPGEDLVDSDKFKATLDAVADQGVFEELHHRLHDVRRMGLAGDDECPDHQCAELTLFWDDPRRNPWDAELTHMA